MFQSFLSSEMKSFDGESHFYIDRVNDRCQHCYINANAIIQPCEPTIDRELMQKCWRDVQVPESKKYPLLTTQGDTLERIRPVPKTVSLVCIVTSSTKPNEKICLC